MKTETRARYRAATERKYGRVFSDSEWDTIIGRFVQKRRARYAVAKNLERGVITAYICEFCGSNDSEAHHPDYAFPLAVVWLCKSHHRREHVALGNMHDLQRSWRNDDMLRLAQKRVGTIGHWSITEALSGYGPQPEEPLRDEDWGLPEDFQETLVEYDAEEVHRSDATSEDCLPEFRHAGYESESPHCGGSI